MSGIYKEINGVIRRAGQGFIGIDGKARRISKGYIGVNGKAREFWGRVVLPIPTPVNLAPAWRGLAITPEWNNYDSTIMTMSGETSATAVGNHTVTFAIIDPDNYVFANGEITASATWQIMKTTVNFWGDTIIMAFVGGVKNWDVLVRNSDNLVINPGALSCTAYTSDTSKAVINGITTHNGYVRVQIRGIAPTGSGGRISATILIRETENTYINSWTQPLEVRQ